MFYYDWTMILVLPGLLLAMFAQAKISSTYNTYRRVRAQSGMTAAQCAMDILQKGGAGDVRVERISGKLTDHYDPREKVLRLSQDVYDSSSIAALGVAAHEAGHALQDAQDYAPLALRNNFAPVASLGSNAAVPLFLVGLLFSWQPLLLIGLVFFGFAVLFSLITLPVEFNASSRALAILGDGGYLTAQENEGAKKVLSAAALTYVASALTAILQFVRLLLISGVGRRRND